MKQGPSSPKAGGARGLKQSQSPDSARLPFLSKRAQSHKAALEQQAAEAAERLATKRPPTKEKKANQVKKKLAKRPAAAMAGQRLETRPALKRPASQSTSAVEQKKQEQGPEIRPWFSGWLKVKAGKYSKQWSIQGCWGDKWILLVACTEKQAAQYPGLHGAGARSLRARRDLGRGRARSLRARRDPAGAILSGWERLKESSHSMGLEKGPVDAIAWLGREPRQPFKRAALCTVWRVQPRASSEKSWGPFSYHQGLRLRDD